MPQKQCAAHGNIPPEPTVITALLAHHHHAASASSPTPATPLSLPPTAALAPTHHAALLAAVQRRNAAVLAQHHRNQIDEDDDDDDSGGHEGAAAAGLVGGLDLSYHPTAAEPLRGWGAAPFACLGTLRLRGCGLRALPVLRVGVRACVCIHQPYTYTPQHNKTKYTHPNSHPACGTWT